jgi:hypothetical protein
MLAGQEIVGASVFVTVTVNEQLSPELEVTDTVVSPTGKKLPDAGEAVTVPQLPVASESKVTTVPG